MLEIVEALDGSLCLSRCLQGGGCERKAWCPAHGVWANAQRAVAHVLASERLDRLAAEAVHNRSRVMLAAPVRAADSAVPIGRRPRRKAGGSSTV